MAAYLANKPDDSVAGARPFSGYIYNSTWAGATAPSGLVFPPGPAMAYNFEGAIACPIGRLYDNTSSNYTECVLNLY